MWDLLSNIANHISYKEYEERREKKSLWEADRECEGRSDFGGNKCTLVKGRLLMVLEHGVTEIQS